MKTINWEDIGCVARIKKEEFYLEFWVYEVIGHSDDGKGNYTVKYF